MFSKTPWRIIWRLMGECPLPVNLKAFNFAQSFLNVYIHHSWCPNSSRLHSKMKNVLRDFLVNALETNRRISSSSSPTGRKFWKELPKGFICHSWFRKSLEDAKSSFWLANYGIIAISIYLCKRGHLAMFNTHLTLFNPVYPLLTH